MRTFHTVGNLRYWWRDGYIYHSHVPCQDSFHPGFQFSHRKQCSVSAGWGWKDFVCLCVWRNPMFWVSNKNDQGNQKAEAP